MHLKVKGSIKQSPNRIMCCKTIAQQTKKGIKSQIMFLKETVSLVPGNPVSNV